MKFVVSKAELTTLIRKIQNVVPQNPTLPILSHFLLEAEEERLIFTATDLMVGTRCSVPAKIYEKGSLTIPSKHFFQLVRELTEQTIQMVAAGSEMAEIQAGSSRFRLHGMDKEVYPLLPDLHTATQFSMPSGQLKEMLYRTSYAVAKEENRQTLAGLLLRIRDGLLICVGTDGKRLAKTEEEISLPPTFSGDYVLPLKAVDEIMKMLTEGERATLYLTEDKVAVELDNTLLVTKLLAGSYPHFEQITASPGDLKITLHREELITLLRQISLFTNEGHSVRFTFLPGELLLTSNCAEVGEGKVSMPVHYTGAELNIAFNPFFFLDILKHSKDETISLGLSDPYNPGILTDSTRSLFVIMPMRLSNE